MYRVELKASFTCPSKVLLSHVPNVPCGVESQTLEAQGFDAVGFLMYRVELKDCSYLFLCFRLSVFLMYRVELKAFLTDNASDSLSPEFLMYRVELKDDVPC